MGIRNTGRCGCQKEFKGIIEASIVATLEAPIQQEVDTANIIT